MTGCVTKGEEPLHISQAESFTSSSLAEKVGQSQSGDTLVFENTSVLGTDTVIVGREYVAASGRLCRTLLGESGKAMNRIVCQHRQSGWYLAKPLIGQASTARVVEIARAMPGVTVKNQPDDQPEVREDVQRSFRTRPGETLWSFAMRITGNAYNWNEIARFNRIDDATNLEAGTALFIPPGMPLSRS